MRTYVLPGNVMITRNVCEKTGTVTFVHYVETAKDKYNITQGSTFFDWTLNACDTFASIALKIIDE